MPILGHFMKYRSSGKKHLKGKIIIVNHIWSYLLYMGKKGFQGQN